MNVLFLSPNFPAYNTAFAKQLMEHGVQVLGIGESGYDQFSAEQKSSLTEYYYVTSLEDYDAVYRAAAFFIHKYGRIDKVISLNAYWQPLASALRRDYGIDGVTDALPLEKGNYHVTYEALLDGTGTPCLEMCRVVSGNDGSYTLTAVDKTVRNAALKALAKLGIRNDFVTVELKKAGVGYSVVNAYAAPSAFAPDIFNYIFAFDVFSAWAYLVTGGALESTAQKQCVAVAHVVDDREYPNVSPEYFSQMESKILQESSAAAAMVDAAGDTVYIMSADSEEEARGILSAFTGEDLPPFATTQTVHKTAARKTSPKTAVTPEKASAGVTRKTATEETAGEKGTAGRKTGSKPAMSTVDRVTNPSKAAETGSKSKVKKSMLAPELATPLTKRKSTTAKAGPKADETARAESAAADATVGNQPVATSAVSTKARKSNRK